MEEEWRYVVGYEGYYKVSNLGRVMSFQYKFRGKIIAQREHNGYRTVRLCYKGKSKCYFVHVLVMQAFDYRFRETGYDKNLVIDHKDGNRANNSVDNLEWCTQAENLRRSIEKGNRGRPCIDITTGITYKSMADAARDIGTNPIHVKKVCDGTRKSVKGHVFNYISEKGAYKTKSSAK